MIPRTKNEKDVARLSKTMATRQSDLDWIEKMHKKGSNEYFAVFEAKGDWQVIRMFMYRSYSKKNEVFHEPLRYWIKKDGSYVLECKNRQCLGNFYIDPWIVSSEFCIRQSKGNRDIRNLYTDYIRVHSLLPELQRTGFRANGKIENYLMPFHLTMMLLTNNRIETFFKLRQDWLVWKFYHYDILTESIWQSIRVALRHGYHWDSKDEINDWVDMLYDLNKLGLDTRNLHYVCPSNLQEAHEYYHNRLRTAEERKRLAEEMKEVEKYEDTFRANREQFFGMVFCDGKINIQIIPTAKAIKEEGIAMHHCVGCYYNKPNSLILSAKVDGKRMETVEVNLKSYELIQSRGLQNKSTDYHDRIVALINNNMKEIIKRNEAHKMAV